MKKLIALIITYNDRGVFLKNCLDSLLRQTYQFWKIFIVDNSSSSKTKEIIKKYLSDKIKCLEFKENIGSAAIGKAMRIIYQQEDFSWIFLMDDDGELQEDALEKLTASRCFNERTAMLTCKRINLQGNVEQRGFFNFLKLDVDQLPPEEYKKDFVGIGHSSFMGMLINRKAIKHVGFPREDFYLYFEDVEYSLRLSKYGKKFLIPSSIVRHKEPPQERVKVVTKFGLSIPRTKIEDFWRDYYGFRNYFLLARTCHLFPLIFFAILWRLIRALLAVIIFDDYKIRRINTLCRAFYDGLIGRSGKILKTSILFVTMGRQEPASRFRVQQYLPLLKKEGYKFLVLPLYLGKTSYSVSKISRPFWAISIIFMKFFTILFAPFYDIIFLQRSVIRYFSPLTERIIKLLNKNIIFDFDDAIWLNYRKRPSPVAEVIKLSERVICGNSYLADYAKKYNQRITVIPTALDTEKYFPSKRRADRQGVVLGWTGSSGNLRYLYDLRESLFKKIAQEFLQIKLRILCDQKPIKDLGIKTEYIRWSTKNEVAVINSFDIGLMPLPDNEWTRGKCAFKILQYMACAVPPIASKVGMNEQVINHGEDGYLVTKEDEWLLLVRELIKNKGKRTAIGLMARKKIEDKYSIKANFALLEKVLKTLS